jgi:hypothetical protein
MQILSSGSAPAYSGVIRSTYQIATGEGILSLWRGMSSVIVGAGECNAVALNLTVDSATCRLTMLGPAHAVYFATYEAVKHAMGGNQAGVHHPLAAGTLIHSYFAILSSFIQAAQDTES